MFKHLMLIIWMILAVHSLTNPSRSKQYRKDYIYNKKTDAFYKLHIETVPRYRARTVCSYEGAKLMVPESAKDISQLHMLLKNYPDLGPYVWIEDDGKIHASVEEQPLIDLESRESTDPPFRMSQCDVVTRRGDVESLPCNAMLPFVCKVEAKEAPYDPVCDVYGKEYIYNVTLGSCYRVSKIAMTWAQGYSECRGDGGAHLLVVNSEEEDQAMVDLLRRSFPENARVHWFYFVGFRAERDADGTRVFRTVFNQTLEEAGFSAWSAGEPNNYQGAEQCGSLFKNNGKFNDVNCAHQFGIICEKEIPARGTD